MEDSSVVHRRPLRSRLDWTLEIVALLAVLGSLALVAYYYPQIPERMGRMAFGRPGGTPLRQLPSDDFGGPLSARTVLWIVAAINTLAYIGLTLGSRGRGLFDIPDHMDRDTPYIRQMLFSMVIVMKAVLALFGAYLVWSLINVGMRTGPGLSATALTVFTLAVPVPLLFYTLKLRRYRK